MVGGKQGAKKTYKAGHGGHPGKWLVPWSEAGVRYIYLAETPSKGFSNA